MVIVILVIELLISIFVLMAGAITFGFAGESNRTPTPLGTVLQFTGLGISFLPVLVLGWTAWRRLGANTPVLSVPLPQEEEARAGSEAAARKERMKERTPRVDWAGLLKRTFDFDVLACERYGGKRRVLAYVMAYA